MKSWYQIDKKPNSGTEMVQDTSMINALKNYLGSDFNDYKLTKSVINRRPMITAKCPKETSEYLEIQKVVQN